MSNKQTMAEISSDEWVKPKAVKDTKVWCGGRVGREHELVMQKMKGSVDCGIGRSFIDPMTKVWHCRHVMVCADCHKVLDTAIPQDCPDRPENR